MDANQLKSDELTAAIREIQQRVRSRHPNGSLNDTGVSAPDLLRVVHARDAADAKVASIGTVNPRAGGLVNSAIQRVKKLISRALDWHVREQVEFNRAVMQCVQSILEALQENNRALSQSVAYTQSEISILRSELATAENTLRGELQAVAQQAQLLRAEAAELKDIRAHWQQWRQGWEEKLNRSEVHMLRTISEQHAAFQHRSTLTEESFRKAMDDHNQAFRDLQGRSAAEIQQRLWADLKAVRSEYEKLIFDELRVIRQRAGANPPAVTAAQPVAAEPTAPTLDWLRFADRFRGSEDAIRRGQSMYTERFAGAVDVLDIGCGRGEFLEAAREDGIQARGIDLSEECVAICRSKGLNAEVADLFAFLASLPDQSLGGVYCSQVVEHLSPAGLPEMVRLLGSKLRPGALAAFETPNPECLAIFASHFYLDPTHTRPVPIPLLAFYLEETGFGEISVQRLAPAVNTMPALDELPERFRNDFFGALDYAMFARKL